MEGDDEFGDLYAGMDGSGEAQASQVPEQVSCDEFDIYGGLCETEKTPPKQGEEEHEFDLYGGFANSSRKHEHAPKPGGFTQIESSNKQMQPQAPPPPPVQRPTTRPPGDSDSDSDDDDDDDLQIVLNSNYNQRRPDGEPGTSGGETNETVEDVLPPPGASSQAWAVDEQLTVQAEPPPPPALVQQPTPMVIPGIPPGILPPGLVPGDQALRPPGLPPPRPPGPPRPLMQPQFKYVRGPPPGHMNMNPGVRGFAPVRPGPRPWTGPPGFGHTEHHLPPTKSVFDLDLDGLEEKPWRRPNADITDYFNFGLNEVTWKAYCQQLNQARLKATMQNKISVYESGRSDLPIGKAIQVEGGVGERRASIDLRRNRNRDSNEVIEIVLQEPDVETPYYGNDYDGSVTEEMTDMLRMRNGPYADGEAPYFPMGARPRGPYRMYPGGPYGRGVMRPPFPDAGMPPPPIHMRPEGFPGAPGDVGDSRKSARTGEDEQSDASAAVKEEARQSSDRRESSQKQEDDDKTDEKRLLSDKRHSDDDENYRSRHRSRKEGTEEHSKRPSERERQSERERSERPDKEKDRDQRKDEDWSKRAHQSRDEARWKDDRKRRDDERRRDDDRKRDKAEEWQRRDREDSYKRDREDSQKRKSSYESSKRYDKPSAEEEDYMRRRRKYKDHGDDDYHEHRKTSSSRKEREHSEEEERGYKDKHGHWKSKDDGRRNGSTSEYHDDRKKRKTGDSHVDKVADEEVKKSRSQPSRTEPYGSESSDNDDDGKHRKGRSKMERLNRERPPVADEEEEYARRRHEGEAPSQGNGSNRQEFLDSVARRKERFSKMESQERRPSEKEKQAQVETAEFKHERPSRKRRWGS